MTSACWPTMLASWAECVQMCSALWEEAEAPGLRPSVCAPDHSVWLVPAICTVPSLPVVGEIVCP